MQPNSKSTSNGSSLSRTSLIITAAALLVAGGYTLGSADRAAACGRTAVAGPSSIYNLIDLRRNATSEEDRRVTSTQMSNATNTTNVTVHSHPNVIAHLPPIDDHLLPINRSHAASRLLGSSRKPSVIASHCPDEDVYLALWLLLLAQSGDEDANLHASRPLTIVDVGINKGYSVAGMFEGLALAVPPPSRNAMAWNYDPSYATAPTPEMQAAAAARRTNENAAGFFSKRALHRQMQLWYPQGGSLGGNCGESGAAPLYHPSGRLVRHPLYANKTRLFVPRVEVYGVDGMKAHAELCDRFFNSQNEAYVSHSVANNLPYTNFTFSCLFSAVSNVPGTVRFPQAEIGNELGKIGTGDMDVPMTTLEKMLPPHVDTIDILLTDTEGNDFNVFEGGLERYFAKGRVGIYVFETHYGPNTRSLKSVLLELEYYGYECFFPLYTAGPYLTPITPVAERYHPSFDGTQRGWKNVVCVQTSTFPQLAALVRELTSTDPLRHR